VSTASKPLKLGISACYFHADPGRAVFKGKTLLYLERSMSQWVASRGDLPFLIPDACEPSRYAAEMDALLLQGGSDLSPESYGEVPLKPEWSGDRVRDLYEMALVRAFVSLGKPVLGVCRGAQLLNVCFGGSLFQDIGTQQPGALTHRDWQAYDRLHHRVEAEPDSWLAGWMGREFTVNTVHHQGLSRLGKGVVVEGRCPEDGMVEAIRIEGVGAWVYGVQWHPEFVADARSDVPALADGAPVLDAWLAADREARRN
jgi:putative glutamine amidotransferase